MKNTEKYQPLRDEEGFTLDFGANGELLLEGYNKKDPLEKALYEASSIWKVAKELSESEKNKQPFSSAIAHSSIVARSKQLKNDKEIAKRTNEARAALKKIHEQAYPPRPWISWIPFGIGPALVSYFNPKQTKNVQAMLKAAEELEKKSENLKQSIIRESKKNYDDTLSLVRKEHEKLLDMGDVLTEKGKKNIPILIERLKFYDSVIKEYREENKEATQYDTIQADLGDALRRSMQKGSLTKKQITSFIFLAEKGLLPSYNKNEAIVFVANMLIEETDQLFKNKAFEGGYQNEIEWRPIAIASEFYNDYKDFPETTKLGEHLTNEMAFELKLDSDGRPFLEKYNPQNLLEKSVYESNIWNAVKEFSEAEENSRPFPSDIKDSLSQLKTDKEIAKAANEARIAIKKFREQGYEQQTPNVRAMLRKAEENLGEKLDSFNQSIVKNEKNIYDSILFNVEQSQKFLLSVGNEPLSDEKREDIKNQITALESVDSFIKTYREENKEATKNDIIQADLGETLLRAIQEGSLTKGQITSFIFLAGEGLLPSYNKSQAIDFIGKALAEETALLFKNESFEGWYENEPKWRQLAIACEFYKDYKDFTETEVLGNHLSAMRTKAIEIGGLSYPPTNENFLVYNVFLEPLMVVTDPEKKEMGWGDLVIQKLIDKHHFCTTSEDIEILRNCIEYLHDTNDPRGEQFLDKIFEEMQWFINDALKNEKFTDLERLLLAVSPRLHFEKDDPYLAQHQQIKTMLKEKLMECKTAEEFYQLNSHIPPSVEHRGLLKALYHLVQDGFIEKGDISKEQFQEELANLGRIPNKEDLNRLYSQILSGEISQDDFIAAMDPFREELFWKGADDYEQLAYSTHDVDELRVEIEEIEQKQIKPLEDDIAKLHVQITQWNKDITQLNSEIEILNSDIRKLSPEIKAVHEEIEQLKTDIAVLEKNRNLPEKKKEELLAEKIEFLNVKEKILDTLFKESPQLEEKEILLKGKKELIEQWKKKHLEKGMAVQNKEVQLSDKEHEIAVRKQFLLKDAGLKPISVAINNLTRKEGNAYAYPVFMREKAKEVLDKQVKGITVSLSGSFSQENLEKLNTHLKFFFSSDAKTFSLDFQEAVYQVTDEYIAAINNTRDFEKLGVLLSVWNLERAIPIPQEIQLAWQNRVDALLPTATLQEVRALFHSMPEEWKEMDSYKKMQAILNVADSIKYTFNPNGTLGVASFSNEAILKTVLEKIENQDQASLLEKIKLCLQFEQTKPEAEKILEVINSEIYSGLESIKKNEPDKNQIKKMQSLLKLAMEGEGPEKQNLLKNIESQISAIKENPSDPNNLSQALNLLDILPAMPDTDNFRKELNQVANAVYAPLDKKSMLNFTINLNSFVAEADKTFSNEDAKEKIQRLSEMTQSFYNAFDGMPENQQRLIQKKLKIDLGKISEAFDKNLNQLMKTPGKMENHDIAKMVGQFVLLANMAQAVDKPLFSLVGEETLSQFFKTAQNDPRFLELIAQCPPETFKSLYDALPDYAGTKENSLTKRDLVHLLKATLVQKLTNYTQIEEKDIPLLTEQLNLAAQFMEKENAWGSDPHFCEQLLSSLEKQKAKNDDALSEELANFKNKTVENTLIELQRSIINTKVDNGMSLEDRYRNTLSEVEDLENLKSELQKQNAARWWPNKRTIPDSLDKKTLESWLQKPLDAEEKKLLTAMLPKMDAVTRFEKYKESMEEKEAKLNELLEKIQNILDKQDFTDLDDEVLNAMKEYKKMNDESPEVRAIARIQGLKEEGNRLKEEIAVVKDVKKNDGLVSDAIVGLSGNHLPEEPVLKEQTTSYLKGLKAVFSGVVGSLLRADEAINVNIAKPLYKLLHLEAKSGKKGALSAEEQKQAAAAMNLSSKQREEIEGSTKIAPKPKNTTLPPPPLSSSLRVKSDSVKKQSIDEPSQDVKQSQALDR